MRSNPPTERTLYTVTLPWNPQDPDEGTYGSSVWAVDEGSAAWQVALEMSGVTIPHGTKAEKTTWAMNLINRAGSTQKTVVRVIDTVEQDLRMLIAGPDCDVDPEKSERLNQFLELLGIRRPADPAEKRWRPRG